MTFHSAWGFWAGEPGMDRLTFHAIADVIDDMRHYETIAYNPALERASWRPEPVHVFAGVELA